MREYNIIIKAHLLNVSETVKVAYISPLMDEGVCSLSDDRRRLT